MFSNAIPNQGDFRGLSVSIWRQTGFGDTRLCLQFWRLSSCAVSPIGRRIDGEAGSEAKQDAVASRVGERWDALIKGDSTKAYAVSEPGVARDDCRSSNIKALRATWRFAQPRSTASIATAERCRVKLSVTYDHRLMKGVTTPSRRRGSSTRASPGSCTAASERCKKSLLETLRKSTEGLAQSFVLTSKL